MYYKNLDLNALQINNNYEIIISKIISLVTYYITKSERVKSESKGDII